MKFLLNSLRCGSSCDLRVGLLTAYCFCVLSYVIILLQDMGAQIAATPWLICVVTCCINCQQQSRSSMERLEVKSLVEMIVTSRTTLSQLWPL